MDEPSRVSTPQAPAEFPNGDCKRGSVYQLANPVNAFQQIIVMSLDTYSDTGTLIQTLRGVCAEQDKKLKEVIEENRVWQARLGDALNRLENLRAIRRAEKRPEVEAALLDLPSEYLPKG